MPKKPAVISAIEAQRAALLAREAETMQVMIDRWHGVELALQDQMDEFAKYLEILRDSGQVITTERLMQMNRYQNMIIDAKEQQAQYSDWLANALTTDQIQLVAEGVRDGQEVIRAAGLDAGIQNLAFDHINAQGVEFMAGFSADGTPLSDLLKESYPDSVGILTQNLVDGLATGAGPRATALIMQQAMGNNLDRAMKIAVTEQNRALRAGTIDQLKQSQVVDGYVRRAQRNASVCPGCLALDGQLQKTSDIFASHPVCHCFAQPHLRFGPQPAFDTGPEWLAKQSESTQLKILGTGRYEMYKNGSLNWKEVVRVKHDPIWGPTIGLTPLKVLDPTGELRGKVEVLYSKGLPRTTAQQAAAARLAASSKARMAAKKIVAEPPKPITPAIKERTPAQKAAAERLAAASRRAVKKR